MNPAMAWSDDHEGMDECVLALRAVHAFLHNELSEADADVIRHHLHACERCMDNFEIETAITEMVRRSQKCQAAPATLRARITQITIRRS